MPKEKARLMMLWIFLPAFNEANTLPSLLTKIGNFGGRFSGPYRIVIVDDGSTDNTSEVAMEFAGRMPIDVVRHEINRGLGETERDGFEYVAERCSPEDILVRLDADDTHEPEYILKLIEKIWEGYDVVNTSRFQAGGSQVGVSTYRAFVSLCANKFMKLIFNISGIRDYSCGFRAYRGQVLKDCVSVFGNGFIQLKGLGFTSTLETLVKLNLLGCKFAEVPFVLRYDQKRSQSKMVSSVTTLGYLMMAILYHWPFGGWRVFYRELRNEYARDREQAVTRFHWKTASRSALHKIG